MTGGLSPSSEHDVIRRPNRLKQCLDIWSDLRATQVTDGPRPDLWRTDSGWGYLRGLFGYEILGTKR